MRQVALIGAGFIAEAHLEALRQVEGVRVGAVVDPSLDRAESLARRAGGASAHASIEALLAAGKPDAAHVLTPPPLHRATAEPLLRAGVPVLLEKPMAETPEDCRALMEAATASGAALKINHNFVHHPAFVKLSEAIDSGKYGRLRAVQMRYAAPLRQLTARAFGHWMFDSSRNLLLEQAVHPLSLIDALIGEAQLVEAVPAPFAKPADGIEIANRWTMILRAGNREASLQLVLGANYPAWTISALCDDGVIEAEMFENRVTARGGYAEIAPLDHAKRGFRVARGAAAEAARGIGSYTAELLRLGPKSDGFNRSMGGAIAAFYDELDSYQKGGARPDGATGLRLVGQCGDAAAKAPTPAIAAVPLPGANATYDVAVLGGTGFIGQHLTRALLDAGKRVAVMARTTKNLPGLFHDPRVGVFRGSISDPVAVAEVVARAPQVVNLAHGGGGADRAAIEKAMVGGAKTVARACLEAGSERLLFVSSSAALYLGDPLKTLDHASGPDAQPEARGDYGYAKVKAEEAMLAMHREAGLPVSILRPAVVVGEGTSPFHSALGAYNTDTHCVGWSGGTSPLPFVLGEDVAGAILRALEVEREAVVGKALNLVGDVRWSARRYTEELAKATGRPLAYHPKGMASLAGMEWLKWAAKRASGRKGVPTPSSRDLRSRGMVSKIDTRHEKELLGWEPVADEATFRARAIDVHREG